VNAGRYVSSSGIGYESDFALTASHVVEQDEDILIIDANGRKAQARVAGRDQRRDLVLLQVEEKILEVAELSKVDAKVGQLVLAIGRPGVEGIQASMGIVTTIGGPIKTWQGGMLERFLKTDATLTRGFSGGPLVDTEGRLLGINALKLDSGFSLTIPIKLAWQVAAQLAERGSIKQGYLGVRSQIVSLSAEAQKELGRDQDTGLLLLHIEIGSPAAQSGLIVSDLIVGFRKKPVTSSDELLTMLGSDVVGKEVPVEVLRGGETKVITVKVGELKESIGFHGKHRRCGW
jgi:S1-C subfamily serine protease